MKTVMWRVFFFFMSRPRTFLCVRLHSCGGGAIQGFDWIVRSGLAKALGLSSAAPQTQPQPPTRRPRPRLGAARLSALFLVASEPDWTVDWTWSMTGWSCGWKMGGATVWVGGWGGLSDTQEKHMARCDSSKHLEWKKTKTFMQEIQSVKTENEWACSTNTRYDSVLTRHSLYLTIRCVPWLECNWISTTLWICWTTCVERIRHCSFYVSVRRCRFAICVRTNPRNTYLACLSKPQQLYKKPFAFTR